jgi:hypothetical protein
MLMSSQKKQRTLVAAIYTAPYYFLAIMYFLYMTHSSLSPHESINCQFESQFLRYQVIILLIISWCMTPHSIIKSRLNQLMIGLYAYLITSLLLNFIYYYKYITQTVLSNEQKIHEFFIYTASYEPHFLYSNIDWILGAALFSFVCGSLCQHLLGKQVTHSAKIAISSKSKYLHRTM